jgi:hypothetical protein
MEISFERLEKQNKELAEEFLKELELLPVFLNYFPDVQEKWLHEAGVKPDDVAKIKQVASHYAAEKVKLENKLLPQEREQVIRIEDAVLKNLFSAKLYKISAEPNKVGKLVEAVLKQEYPEAAVLAPEQLKKIERFTLFEHEEKRFPMHYLVFDPKGLKIIGIEVVKK